MKWVQLFGSSNILWHCLSLGLKWKLTFSSPVVTAEFPNLLACWMWHFNSIIFLNSSGRIPSPPLALFFVIFPKAHLTLHSRKSDSRSVTIPLWLSWSFRPFLYSYSVYFCYLFLISSASVRSLLFLSFIVPNLNNNQCLNNNQWDVDNNVVSSRALQSRCKEESNARQWMSSDV